MTGLTGNWTLPQRYTLGEGDEKWTFPRGYELLWTVRWDFDPRLQNGLHVNTQFGRSRPQLVKYSWTLLPTSPQYSTKGPVGTRQERTYNELQYRLNKFVGYEPLENLDPGAERVFPEGERLALEAIKYYFRRVAVGELPY